MENKEALDAIEKLIEADGGVSLPGLEFDTVVKNFVDKKYGAKLEGVKNEEEREKLRDKWTEYYKNGEGRETLQLEIASIKSNFSAAQDQLKFVTEAAASSVASNAIPSVITTGAAASVPNPAYTIIENRTKKNQLLAMLKQVSACLVNLLKSAVAICFAIPSVVISLIETLTTVKKTVNEIPS